MAKPMQWSAANKTFGLADGTVVGQIPRNHLDEQHLTLDHLRETTMAELRDAIFDALPDLPLTRKATDPLPAVASGLAELCDDDRGWAFSTGCAPHIYLQPIEYVTFSTVILGYSVSGDVYAWVGFPNPLRIDNGAAARALTELALAKGWTLQHVSFNEPDWGGVEVAHIEALLEIHDLDATVRDLEAYSAIATQLMRIPPPDMLAIGASPHAQWELARRMLLFGHSSYLLGHRESSWLEVKSRGYDLAGSAGRIELAQDVARFANGDGPGLLVLGYRTKGKDGSDLVVKHCPLPIDREECDRYRAVIDKKVFPPVRGLTVDHVPHENGATVVITVPEQDDHDRPFLVHGAMVEGRHEGGFISIVRRRSEHSIPIEPAAIHAALAAGRRMLRDSASDA